MKFNVHMFALHKRPKHALQLILSLKLSGPRFCGGILNLALHYLAGSRAPFPIELNKLDSKPQQSYLLEIRSQQLKQLPPPLHVTRRCTSQHMDSKHLHEALSARSNANSRKPHKGWFRFHSRSSLLRVPRIPSSLRVSKY